MFQNAICFSYNNHYAMNDNIPERINIRLTRFLKQSVRPFSIERLRHLASNILPVSEYSVFLLFA